MERERPLVCILTDGRGRIESSRKVIEKAGARIGPIFGRWTDEEAYAMLLDHRFDGFLEAANEIAAIRADLIVGDALEGYNSLHDVCRMMIDAAAGRIRNLDFTLTGRPEEWRSKRGITVELDDDEFARKKASAVGYPELSAELLAALQAWGESAFRVECLRPVRRRLRPPGGKPYYETHAERKYPRVIRYRDHLAPLGRALRGVRCGS